MSNPAIFERFMSLPQGEKVLAEYIWIGGSGLDIRSKTKTMEKEVKSLDDLPVWNFDGSSTKQAEGNDSEVYLKPVAYYPDPFRRGKNIIVLCETCMPDEDLTPHKTNTRRKAAELFEKGKECKPWFGIEQEYTLFSSDGRTPLGWPKNGFPAPQGPYYCSNGAEVSFGRDIVESHYRCCLYAGVKISGVNAEVMAGQWEYQVGPCEGIESGDHMVLSRYLLLRVCEAYNVVVSFDPKPIEGDWNGAGAHVNYSTEKMRGEGGIDFIHAAVKRLSLKHDKHIKEYGAGNDRRLTGDHETASLEQFSSGVADRGASIRIPRTTAADGRGYLEDRRPASNIDPYKVTGLIFETTCMSD